MARALKMYTAGPVEIAFDAARCIHAAECVSRLPAVFDANARPWIRPANADTDAIVATVLACPTGALRVRVDGTAIERPPARTEVRLTRDGPLVVRGAARVATADGETVDDAPRLALCRCGQSRRQPWCDGSHTAAGFRAPDDQSGED